MHNKTDVADLLLKKEADINAANCEGFTPLHCAAMEDSTGVASLLL
jgi:ankyrin repeat protein